MTLDKYRKYSFGSTELLFGKHKYQCVGELCRKIQVNRTNRLSQSTKFVQPDRAVFCKRKVRKLTQGSEFLK